MRCKPVTSVFQPSPPIFPNFMVLTTPVDLAGSCSSRQKELACCLRGLVTLMPQTFRDESP
ncbi:MAG TPA: hypothetical protein PKC25_16405, partial [Candidatus Rifleibacterium sp.]|nr:hypothetical protein [Candidatus Rifleibacterium sp.]